MPRLKKAWLDTVKAERRSLPAYADKGEYENRDRRNSDEGPRGPDDDEVFEDAWNLMDDGSEEVAGEAEGRKVKTGVPDYADFDDGGF